VDELSPRPGNSWGKFGHGDIFGIDEDKMFRATQLLWDYLYFRKRLERNQRRYAKRKRILILKETHEFAR